MSFSNPSSITRQRGVTLIDLMIGLVIGMLVVLIGLGSVIFTYGSARTMSDSAGLEQQATLVMTQIGQQIKQAGAINGYPSGFNPDLCTTTAADCSTTAVTGLINFDNRATDIPASIVGRDGGSNPDTLVISYARPNDGSPAFNCIGQDGPDTPYTSASGLAQIVNQFSVDTNNNLVCGDSVTAAIVPGVSGSAGGNQPIAANVRDMRIRYLLTAANGDITYQAVGAITNWAAVNGLQVCLEMQGDPTGAPDQTYTNCQGNSVTSNDARIHRIVKQTFSLRNSN